MPATRRARISGSIPYVRPEFVGVWDYASRVHDEVTDADLGRRGINPNAPIACFIKRLRCRKCGSQSVRAEMLKKAG